MLDRKFIVENADRVKQNCANRGVKCDVDQLVELVVNNRTLAHGEIVTVDGFYGIRITEITSAGERFKSLGS